MIKLFTHTDLDGVGCAILAQKVFGRNDVSIDYCDYNNINLKIEEYINSEEYLNYDFCFITDISLSEEMAKRIDGTSLRNNFQLLDHHSTAESLNKYWCWCKVNVINSNTGIKTSGTEMFYDFLVEWLDTKKTDILDRFVQTIRDYDTWRWSELGDNGLICKQINDLFYLYGRDEFIVWAISQLHDQVFPRLYEADKLVLKLRQREIDQYVEEKNKELVGYNILGYNVGVVLAERFSSELGNRLCVMNPNIDFVAIINGMKTVSYRTIKDNIDLGKDIASKFGGGGHAKSAGSQIEERVFNDAVNNIFKSNIQRKVIDVILDEGGEKKYKYSNGTYLVRLCDFKTKSKTKDKVVYDCSTEFVACVDGLTNGDISKICSENNFSDEEPLVVVRIKDNSVTEYVGAVFKDYINNQIVIDKNLSLEV